jgi:hypothetical protein
MRKAVLAVVLLGCGGSSSNTPDSPAVTIDAPKPIDAPPLDAYVPDVSCSGHSLPTTAPDPVTISGTVDAVTATGNVATGSITVDAFLANDQTPRSTTKSDAQGAFSMSVTTNSVANSGYLRASGSGTVTTYNYPATPVYQNLTGTTVAIVTADEEKALADAAGISQNAGDSLLSIQVVDCAGVPLAGVIITSPSGAVFYTQHGAPTAAATATDASGLVYVFNVPPGDVIVNGVYDANVLRSHTVGVFSGSPTFTVLQP